MIAEGKTFLFHWPFKCQVMKLQEAFTSKVMCRGLIIIRDDE